MESYHNENICAILYYIIINVIFRGVTFYLLNSDTTYGAIFITSVYYID